MGLGRREFLKVLGSAVVAAVEPTRAAAAVVGDVYINRLLGITFRKPAGWEYAEVTDMGEVKAGQILDLDNPDLAQSVLDVADLPLISFSRDGISADSDRFTPGVNVYLTHGGLDGPGGLPAVVEADADACAAILKDFRLTSPPAEQRISECDAISYEATFLFEHVNMLATPVRMKTLVIDQGSRFYTVRMYDSPDAAGPDRYCYREFIESVSIL